MVASVTKPFSGSIGETWGTNLPNRCAAPREVAFQGCRGHWDPANCLLAVKYGADVQQPGNLPLHEHRRAARQGCACTRGPFAGEMH